MDELLKLTRENNTMLKYIVQYIQHEQGDGQMNNFLINVIANQFNFNDYEYKRRLQ